MAKCETKYPVFNRLFIRFREIPGIYKICPLKIGTEFYLIWSVDIFDFYRVIVLRNIRKLIILCLLYTSFRFDAVYSPAVQQVF